LTSGLIGTNEFNGLISGLTGVIGVIGLTSGLTGATEDAGFTYSKIILKGSSSSPTSTP
jgi:hypothetical protein